MEVRVLSSARNGAIAKAVALRALTSWNEDEDEDANEDGNEDAHVHAHGKRFDLLGLARAETGAELSPAPLLRYLRERYLALYAA